MLPGPRLAYNPYRNLGKVLNRSDMILRKLRSNGVISADEYQAALAHPPNIAGLQRKIDTAILQEAVMQPLSSATLAPASAPVTDKPERDEAIPVPPTAEKQDQPLPTPAGDR
jgi:monofunctional biosynthetic peptidoglycan transglycosylase